MKTGVCYYPEHWPEAQWQVDAGNMHSIGLRVVRIGEFAWSRLEPVPGQLDFDWLDRAVNTLHDAGLQVVLGTPTATPPRWMISKHPDMLALDEHGHVRGFGSRRHYCFSHDGYRDECKRIVTLLAERYGNHPAIIAWQTDNEYGCHSTTIGYSAAARMAFQQWCEQRYKIIEALNSAWGNVFWSMEYNSFSDIDVPALAVTELNPAHRLAFWRFSSDQVKSFNRLQVDILRTSSPGRDIVHNFMGNFTEFDHFDVAADLDIASWDNYPLGFLTRDGVNDADKQQYLRTGHPDGSAFHHDLYRTCGNGRMWLMEQQPGPVNWAPYNPSPLPGMVRLWGWEAFAHGAEVASYFRWRQAPFAQEQMHSGLCLPNGKFDDAAFEIEQLNDELSRLPDNAGTKSHARVAILFDYAGDQVQRIQQPGGRHYDPLVFVQRVYSACRQLGVNTDIVSAHSNLQGYEVLLVVSAAISDQQLVDKLTLLDSTIVLFPRSGSKTAECAIAENLPPGAFRQLIDVSVTRVESLPPDASVRTDRNRNIIDWRERVDAPFAAQETCADGWGFHYIQDKVHYINGCLVQADLVQLLLSQFEDTGIPAIDLGDGLRIRRCNNLVLAFNYEREPVHLDEELLARLELEPAHVFLVGKRTLQPADVSIWQLP